MPEWLPPTELGGPSIIRHSSLEETIRCLRYASDKITEVVDDDREPIGHAGELLVAQGQIEAAIAYLTHLYENSPNADFGESA